MQCSRDLTFIIMTFTLNCYVSLRITPAKPHGSPTRGKGLSDLRGRFRTIFRSCGLSHVGHETSSNLAATVVRLESFQEQPMNSASATRGSQPPALQYLGFAWAWEETG